ncbi:MAG: hypothetical protein KAI79_11895 [Bacteroidales bacterium]|nr:hypothetical protein [Bacteroidales bacterium]
MSLLTNKRILEEFKTIIIPGIFGDTFENVDIDKSTVIFERYMIGLQHEKFIDATQASQLEVEFTKIMQERV